MREENQKIRMYIIEGKNEQEHFHQEIELIYVLDGFIELKITGERYLLQKDSVILINSNKPHLWKVQGENLLCIIYIDYPMLTSVLKKQFISFWCNSLLNQDEDYNQLRSILNRGILEYSAQNGGNSFQLQIIKYQILECLVKNFILQSNELADEIADERVYQAIQYVNSHYFRPITLSEIASRLYMSDSSFSRLFKKVTGANFVDYVNNNRLHYAVENLLYSSKSVTLISEECGFSNPSAFNKLFKRVYQCSPTQYRKIMKQNIVTAQFEHNNNNSIEKKLKKRLKAAPPENLVAAADFETAVITSCDPLLYHREANLCINMGIGADLLQARLREHLRILRDNLGFRYVRIGDLFHKTMYVQIPKQNTYNFDLLDNIFDFIYELEMYPVIDLTNRVKKAYLDIDNNMYDGIDKEHITVNPEKWEALLGAFIKHIVERYGESSIIEWKFEYGLNGYNSYPEKSYEEQVLAYTHLWEVTWNVIKKASPDFCIGGSGFTVNQDSTNLKRHVKRWNQNPHQPDFLTVYAYPYNDYSKKNEMYTRRETDGRFMVTGVERYKRALEISDIPSKTIWVTEWNTSISERNFYNDSCAKAAHILRQLIAFAGTETVLTYNHGSDFLSLYFDSAAPLIGALGLVTKDGIPKPVYFAFYFMNRLYSSILAKTPHYIVTTNKKDSYRIVVCNAKGFHHNYYLKKESEINIADLSSIFDEDKELKLRFLIKEAVNKKYRIKKYLVSETQGNILNEWKNMNYVEAFDRSDINYMKQLCCPHLYCEDNVADGDGLRFEISLKSHEMMLLHIYSIGS